MLSRRMLLLGGGTLALSVVFAVTGQLGDTADVDASAGDRDSEFTYRGRRVRLRESRTMVMAGISGRGEVHIERPTANRFYSHLVPFQEFGSSRQLVTTLIDLEDAHLVAL